MTARARHTGSMLLATSLAVLSTLGTLASAANIDADRRAASSDEIQLLAPTRSYELNASFGSPFVSPDGRTAFVLDYTETLGLGRLLADWSAWIVTAIIGLSLLWRLFRLRRTARRQPVRGEPYCRKCAYRLTGIDAKRCPECGRDITGRGRTIGKGRRVLLLRGAVSLLVTGSIVAAAHVYDTPLRRAVDRVLFWPSASLHEWASVHEIEWLYTYFASEYELTAVDLTTGAIRWRTRGEEEFYEKCFADDGEWFYMSGDVDEDDRRFVGRFCVADGRWETLLPFAPDDNIWFAGVTTDHQLILNDDDGIYWRVDAITSERQRMKINTAFEKDLPDSTDSTWINDTLCVIHGNGLTLIDLKADRMDRADGNFKTWIVYALTPSHDRIYTDEPTGTMKQVDESKGKVIYSTGIFGGKSFAPIPVAEFVPRGVYVNRPRPVGKMASRFAATVSYVSRMTTDLSGRYAFVLVQVTGSGFLSQQGQDADFVICVWDHHENRLVARLDAGFGSLAYDVSAMEVSRDGRVLTAVICNTNKGGDAVVYVFDLESILGSGLHANE